MRGSIYQGAGRPKAQRGGIVDPAKETLAFVPSTVEEATCIGYKLENNRRVDGNIPAEAEADEEGYGADGGPGVERADDHAENGDDGDGEVEGPAAADDVDEDAPGEGADGEAGGEY